MKKMITLLAVAGLAISTTPAMGGNAVWTGLGADNLWSNTNNWQLADGVTWADDDPRQVTGSEYFLLNDDNAAYDTTTSICDVDTTAAPWTCNHDGRIYLNSNSKLYIPAGGYLERERFITEAGAEIYITGGTLKADSRTSGFYMEISTGTWNCARWTYSSGGTVHIVGSTPTQIYMDDFMSWSATHTSTLQFTLDASGVKPFTFGEYGLGAGITTGSTTIEVAGIENYTGSRPHTNDLLYDVNDALDYTDSFLGLGPVDGGEVRFRVVGGVTNGIELVIEPLPYAGMVLIVK